MTAWVLPLLGLVASASAGNTRLTEVAAWKTLSFQLGDNSRNALETGQLVPQNVFAMGVERWKDKLFITTPRFKPGVPSTLNYIRLDKLNESKSPELIPYPSLEANTWEPKAWPPRLVSVWRVRADACDRLWAVDCGQSNLPYEARQEAPPKILVYDLKSDKLLFTYVMKEKADFTEGSVFQTITVDVTSANCDKAFAYLPDSFHKKLLVYSLHTNSTHLLTHNYFHFDPLAGDFNNAGYTWQWQNGIYGLALSPVDREGYRIVYFHALASNTEFATTTKVLQNASLTPEQRVHSFKVIGGRGPGGQSTTSFLDEETGVLFYTLVNRHAVGCWNSFKGEDYETSSQGIVADDEDTLAWPSDLKVDKQGNLWVLSSSMTDLLFSTINTDSVNFRVFTAPVRHAIKSTVCDDM